MSVNKLLKNMAAKEGTTVEKIREEMQKAIDAGYGNPDPAVKAKWTEMWGEGRKPTVDEFIRRMYHISTELSEDQD